MPVISSFFGILIRMFYQEHEPAHFHAEHRGDHAKFGFDGVILAGRLRSGAARRRVEQWATLHRRELEANWARMKAGQPLEHIEPLE
jgi:hypothetical protein